MCGNSFFGAFRTKPFPTLYSENKTPVTVDVLTSGLIFAFAIVLVSAFVACPGVRIKEQTIGFLRFFIFLIVGAGIIFPLFGHAWEEGIIHDVDTAYKAGTGEEIKAEEIGLHIDLRGVNITLKAEPDEGSSLHGETIDYNERFTWNNPWTQGRIGFGPFAFTFSQQFRDAQRRGLPLPILWIAEYFTIDGEGIRWGRHYKQAGYGAHICLWSAFSLWLITGILSFMIVRYCAACLFLTGIACIAANVQWAAFRNAFELAIPIGDKVIEMEFGWSFWWCLANGLFCIFVALIIGIVDTISRTTIYKFFQLDVTRDEKEIAKIIQDNENGQEIFEYRTQENNFLPSRRRFTRRTQTQRRRDNLQTYEVMPMETMRSGQVNQAFEHERNGSAMGDQPGPSRPHISFEKQPPLPPRELPQPSHQASNNPRPLPPRD